MSHYGKHGTTGGGGVRRPDESPSVGPPRSGSYGGGGRRDQPEDKIDNYWKPYLDKDNRYFDADGHLKPEFVCREKVEPLIQAMARAGLTTGQLRRFFGHCRTLETRLKSGSATWAELRTQFQFLDAAASDAYGKAQRKIPSLFYDFILRNVAAVKSEKDFREGFLPHFEALVGFGSLHIQRDRN